MDGPDNVIGAFSEEHVERLTGVSATQLRYWDRTGFFTPDYAAEDRRQPYSRIYSFRDVVALRVLNALRNTHRVPLQELRRVAENLAGLSNDKWARTTLYVHNRHVVFIEPDSGRRREVVSGQYMADIPLEVVIADTRRDVAKLRQRDGNDIGHIARSRFVNHNAWVVAGTRIPTAAIWRFHEAGYSVDQIIGEYPDLTPDDIAAAIERHRTEDAA